MKSLLLISLVVLGAQANPSWTRCYTEANQDGYEFFFDNYVPDLYSYNFDNVIDSVHQTGMWIYYENYEYNLFSGGVYFVHGIDIKVTFPANVRNKISSLRYVGSPQYLNADTITFYEDEYFGGREYLTVIDADNFGQLSGRISSIVVTGISPWTIYNEENYYGDAMCVYPNTDHDVGSNGQVLDLGIYRNMDSLNIPDNSVKSVRKGCWSKKVAKAPELKVDGRMENGAWGRLN